MEHRGLAEFKDRVEAIFITLLALAGIYLVLKWLVTDVIARYRALQVVFTGPAIRAAKEADDIVDGNVNEADEGEGEQDVVEEAEDADADAATARKSVQRLQKLRAWLFNRENEHQVVAGGTVLIVALLLAGGILTSKAPTFGDNSHAHLSARDALGERQIFGDSAVYYLPFEYTNLSGALIPVMTCAHYDDLSRVHDAVLGSRSTQLIVASRAPKSAKTAPIATADPMRELVKSHCFMEEKSVLPLELAQRATLSVPWKVADIQQRPYVWKARTAGGSVQHVSFDDHAHEPWISVLAVTQDGKGVAPVVVALNSLASLAERWHRGMLDEAEREQLKEDPECLCAEHLGIIDSGLYFLYTEADGRWQLLMHPVVTMNLTKPGQQTNISYNKRLRFPAQIDAEYNPGPCEHFGRLEVSYLNLQRLFDTPAGRTELAKLVPRWVPPESGTEANTPVDEEGSAETDDEDGAEQEADDDIGVTKFHVLSLSALTLKQSATVQKVELTGLANGCLHHCARMSTIARIHLRMPLVTQPVVVYN